MVADHHGRALWLWLADYAIEMETGLSLNATKTKIVMGECIVNKYYFLFYILTTEIV